MVMYSALGVNCVNMCAYLCGGHLTPDRTVEPVPITLVCVCLSIKMYLGQVGGTGVSCLWH